MKFAFWLYSSGVLGFLVGLLFCALFAAGRHADETDVITPADAYGSPDADERRGLVYFDSALLSPEQAEALTQRALAPTARL
jgi:hypothetical protein